MPKRTKRATIDTVKEVVAPVYVKTDNLREMLSNARLRCQRGGEQKTAAQCLDCPRVVNVKPSRDGDSITVRCLWSTEDPIADVMTLASEIVTVEPDLPIQRADRMARHYGIRHLLVAHEGDLIGVACRCDLVPPVLSGETVKDRMTAKLWSLPVWSTLGDAAELMTEREIGFAPVVDGDAVVGVITRGDLRRAGIDESLLGAARCEQCGSHHGVRPHPLLEGIEFCLDCLDRELTPADYVELPA